MSKSNIRNFYEEDAASYDLRRWTSPAGRWRDTAHKEMVKDLLSVCKLQQVLDIGSGTGRFAIWLAQQGANVTAVDFSPQMLAVAREKAAEAGVASQIEFVVANAPHLPLGQKKFDCCICINVLNHTPFYEQIIREAGLVLVPGGKLIMNVPNLVSPYMPIGVYVNLTQHAWRSEVYTRWYTYWQISRSCQQAGLKVEEIRGFLYVPGNIRGVILSGVKWLDVALRSSWLRYFTPNLFFRAGKH